MRLRRRIGAVVAAVLAAAASGCGGSGAGSGNQNTPNLEVVSWWTSGSEQQALTTLFDAYKAEHPGVTVTNAAVAGGGGSNAQVVLAQRLLAGDPPDVWQTFPGGALSAFVGQDQVLDVSPVYALSGMALAMPKVVLDGLTIDGKQYGVPTSSHRGNMLFFHLGLLRNAGVTPPASGYTADAFAADLEKLKAAGITPLCLGAKDPFTTAALFENTLLGVVGPDGWGRIAVDRFDWNGPQARQALDRFGALLDQADPEAAALSWDAATKKLAQGGCAFETLNDSAFGELVKAGAVDGKDFGEVPYPGTEATYVAVVDTFVAARTAANAKNATDFLTVLGSPATQVAFSKAKGSVPIRSDADVSSLTQYQQSAAEALRTRTVLWSIVHGEATSPRFQQGFYDAVGTYVRSRDPAAFSKTLTDALAQQPPAK
jgi:glucose/mannose transport system substrate-binding protein